MKEFGGKILFLDRSDINTDEIIPARYLTEVSKQALAPHLLEDLNLDGFDPGKDIYDKGAIVTRANFGCGSSREHAAWALEVNRINLVIAESFSRIFRQNMFNCGMLAVQLEADKIEAVIKRFGGRTARVAVDLEGSLLQLSVDDEVDNISFVISDFDRALIEAGGWVEYADTRY